MIKISKVFEKYFDLPENILIVYFYFCFSLYNFSDEARPHLPPLTARPWWEHWLRPKNAKKKLNK